MLPGCSDLPLGQLLAALQYLALRLVALHPYPGQLPYLHQLLVVALGRRRLAVAGLVLVEQGVWCPVVHLHLADWFRLAWAPPLRLCI